MKNLYNSNFKEEKLANSVLEKLVLLLSVQYAISCHAISVTDYNFMWYSVVINVMFNTVKPLSIVSKRSVTNKQIQETIGARKLFISNCLRRIAWKLSLLGNFSFKLWIIKVLKISR
jgi:hypothetical protein